MPEEKENRQEVKEEAPLNIGDLLIMWKCAAIAAAVESGNPEIKRKIRALVDSECLGELDRKQINAVIMTARGRIREL